MSDELICSGQETSANTGLGQLLDRHRQIKKSATKTPAGCDVGVGIPFIEKRGSDPDMTRGASSGAWQWWGKPLWHDIGYVAVGKVFFATRHQADKQALIQLVAATVFWISTLTGLPGVIKGLYGENGSVPIIDVFFWTPQGVCLRDRSLTDVINSQLWGG